MKLIETTSTIVGGYPEEGENKVVLAVSAVDGESGDIEFICKPYVADNRVEALRDILKDYGIDSLYPDLIVDVMNEESCLEEIRYFSDDYDAKVLSITDLTTCETIFRYYQKKE